MTYQTLQQAAETRRSVYALNKNLPLPAGEVAAIIEHAVKHTPSSFNSQSTRVVVLFGAEHENCGGSPKTRCAPSCPPAVRANRAEAGDVQSRRRLGAVF